MRCVILALALGACAGRTKLPSAAEGPQIVDADCLTAVDLPSPVDATPPERATMMGPGRWLYVESWTPDSEDPLAGEIAEVWVGIEDASGQHRFWPLADVAAGEYDIGDAKVVGEADVTGDGIAEYLVEVHARSSTHPAADERTEEVMTRTRFVWDPAAARTLATVEVGWGAFVIAPAACDDWCIDGTATTDAEEAGFDCDDCDDTGDEGRQEARLDGSVLVIGEPVRVSGEHSLDGLCPTGRYRWATTGWVRLP